MIIRWLVGDQLDLKPTWEIEFARVHTVKKMDLGGGVREDTLVLYVRATPDQIRKLREEYPGCIDLDILGIKVIPLYANAVLWELRPPKEYPNAFKAERYMGFEIVAEGQDNGQA